MVQYKEYSKMDDTILPSKTFRCCSDENSFEELHGHFIIKNGHFLAKTHFFLLFRHLREAIFGLKTAIFGFQNGHGAF